jgi:hypothetical protein
MKSKSEYSNAISKQLPSHPIRYLLFHVEANTKVMINFRMRK